LDGLSELLNYDVSTLIQLVLEKYLIAFESYMDDIAFSEYETDKRRLENLFQDNPRMLERIHDIFERIESAPDEDARTKILSDEYEQFYAELYKNYKAVRELHK